MKFLSHQSSYEWFGSFWFPEHKDIKFSGKLIYTPETGIKVTLLSEYGIGALCQKIDPENKDYEKAEAGYTFSFGVNTSIKQDIMHASVMGDDGGQCLTLFNVVLQLTHSNFSQQHSYDCNANALIASNIYCSDAIFDNIYISYQEDIDRIFYRKIFKETILQQMAGQTIAVSDYVIEANYNCYGTWKPSETIVDKLGGDAETIKEIRTLIKDKNIHLYDNMELTFKIKKQNTDLMDFLDFESKWRGLWEILIDEVVLIDKLWLSIEETEIPNTHANILINTTQKKQLQPLTEHYVIKLFQFDNNIITFSDTENLMNEWIKITEDSKYSSVIECIRRIIIDRLKVDRMKLVAIYSAINTFVSVNKQETGKQLKYLIDNYAYEAWNSELEQVIGLGIENKGLDCHISQVRACITHSENNHQADKAPYVLIFDNDIQLNNIYAYLCGIFFKAILETIGINSKIELDNYAQEIISRRRFTSRSDD